MTSIDALASGVEWPDTEAAAAARGAVAPESGRLGELAEWLAATLGSWPPPEPSRIRLVLLGAEPDPAVEQLAATLDVTVAPVAAASLDAGRATADAEVDGGADLIVVAASAPDAGAAALPVVASIVTGAEPVTLLPRGAAAVDTEAWIRQAEQVRDAHRSAVALRRDPAALVERLGDATLAAATGFVLQAVLRRTPLVLDGTVAGIAGLLVADLASRAARWWQVADVLPDPVHRRAVEEFDRTPLLHLGIAGPAGTAGLLTVPVLRAAARASGEGSSIVERRTS